MELTILSTTKRRWEKPSRCLPYQHPKFRWKRDKEEQKLPNRAEHSKYRSLDLKLWEKVQCR